VEGVGWGRGSRHEIRREMEERVGWVGTASRGEGGDERERREEGGNIGEYGERKEEEERRGEVRGREMGGDKTVKDRNRVREGEGGERTNGEGGKG